MGWAVPGTRRPAPSGSLSWRASWRLHQPMSEDDRHDTPLRKPRLKRLRFVAILLATLLLGLVSFVFGMFIAVASDLPSLTRFSQLKDARSSVLLDDLGHAIGIVSQQN